MKNKEFTGDVKIFHKCKNFLRQEGYLVADAIHIGNNVFEFTEMTEDARMGCYPYFKLQVCLEDGNLKIIKKHQIAFVCKD